MIYKQLVRLVSLETATSKIVFLKNKNSKGYFITGKGRCWLRSCHVNPNF